MYEIVYFAYMYTIAFIHVFFHENTHYRFCVLLKKIVFFGVININIYKYMMITT